MFLTEDCDFQVFGPIKVSSYLLPVTSNKGSNKGQGSTFISSDLLPLSVNTMFFCLKIVIFQSSQGYRVSSRSVISNMGSNKGQISFCPIYSQKCQSPRVLPKNYNFRVSSFLQTVASIKGHS